MPLPTIPSGNVASATASTGYNIDNSCRFDGTNDFMVRSATGTSSESNNKWTFSCWVKRSKLGAEQMIMDHRGSGNQFNIRFMSDDSIQAYDYVGGILMQKDTNAVYRDVAAWYHILWSSDRSIGSPTTKLWVNGTEVTSWATNNEYSQDDTGAANQNYDTWIGGENSSGARLGAYIAEMVWLDGTFVSDATGFGEYDSDSPTIWKPIDVSGLTFGTNGWYFDFKDSSNLGNDANGGTDFSETGIAATDQATDVPTNNFCTMNPLDNFYVAATFSQGNNSVVIASGIKTYATGTMGVSSGKWYWECELDAHSGSSANDQAIGIADRVSTSASTDSYAASYPANFIYQTDGNFKESGTTNTTSSAPDSLTDGDIIGVALDLDNNKLYFSKNGTWQDSGNPESGATGTGAMTVIAPSHADTSGFYFPIVGSDTTSKGATWLFNFGGSPAFTVSSGNADGNGYGNFEYAVPANYYSINTKNLAEYG